MADISKASRVLDRNLRFREQDATVQAEKQRIIEALRHGNIHEVFAKETKFKIGDFTDFFSNQWRSFKSQIVQDAEIKSAEASCPPPDINDFLIQHQGTAITPEESELFAESMSDFLMSGSGAGAGGKFKAQTADAGGEAAAMGPEELIGLAQSDLEGWDQFQEDIWGTVFDAQLTRDMQNRMAEIRSEVQKILAMVKSGQLGPEFALIALCKVNSTKNGVLMSGLGKKMYHINSRLSEISNDIYSTSVADPQYLGMMTLAKEETRQGAFDLSMLTQDMQKVMQDVSKTFEFTQGALSQINQGRRELLKHVGAGT